MTPSCCRYFNENMNMNCRRTNIKRIPVAVRNSTCRQHSSGHDIKDSVQEPAVTNILLLRAGDVESNPGPKRKHSSHSDGEEDFDDILKNVACYIRGNTAIDTLGKALGFHPAEIERYIASNTRYQHVTYDGTLQMLRDWREKQTGTEERPALSDALKRAGLVHLADALFRTSEPLGSEENLLLPEDEIPESVVDETKRYYILNMCTIQADPTNNDVMFEFDHIYTNLTLLEKDRNNITIRKPLLYCNLLKTKVNGILPNRLLVQAEGGAGKTTLCAKIAWDWVHGLDFQQFKLVAVVPLRKAKNKTVGEIVKSYLSDNNPVKAPRIDRYILSHPKEVFLVLDGLDEFDGEFSDLHQIVQIILNRVFQSGIVLVTSRQWRVHEIRSITELKKVYAFIDIEGFSVDNVAAYITKFFHPDKASSDKLLEFITSNDVIVENMASFPIYIVMLCIMWKEYDGERREAMSRLETFSQLFDEMISFLTDHFLSKSDSQTSPTLQEGREAVSGHLTSLGEIAFQGILDRRLVFPEDTFQNCREALEIGCKVGVLTREKNVTPRRDRRKNPHLQVSMVQFPHKLFQEFLAARYLASLHGSDPSRYKTMMDKLLEKKEEIRYLLYFTSAQGEELGLDIERRLIDQNTGEYFIVDVAYESQNQAVAKAAGNQLMARTKELVIYPGISTHTVSGLLFIWNKLRGLHSLALQKSCGRTASQELAEFISSTPSLRLLKIAFPMHGVFYSVLANRAELTMIEHMIVDFAHLQERESELRDIARFICKMPCLTRLQLRNSRVHEDFFSSVASLGSSARIEKLIIFIANLGKSPSESRDLAKFICNMPFLHYLELQYTKLHKHFYQMARSMASSVKIEHLIIFGSDLSKRAPSSRDLAHFICKMPHLKELELVNTQLHADFFATGASMEQLEKDNGQSTGPHTSLHELILDECVLSEWQPCGHMFDSVERLSLFIWHELRYDLLQMLHVFQGVKGLTILGRHLDTSYRATGEASSLMKDIARVFPNLIAMIFRVHVGNENVRLILESLRETQNLSLKTIRVLRCELDDGLEELDGVISSLNNDNIFRVEVEPLSEVTYEFGKSSNGAADSQHNKSDETLNEDPDNIHETEEMKAGGSDLEQCEKPGDDDEQCSLPYPDFEDFLPVLGLESDDYTEGSSDECDDKSDDEFDEECDDESGDDVYTEGSSDECDDKSDDESDDECDDEYDDDIYTEGSSDECDDKSDDESDDECDDESDDDVDDQSGESDRVSDGASDLVSVDKSDEFDELI